MFVLIQGSIQNKYGRFIFLLKNYFLGLYRPVYCAKFRYDRRRHYFYQLISFQRKGGSFHDVRTRGRVFPFVNVPSDLQTFFQTLEN